MVVERLGAEGGRGFLSLLAGRRVAGLARGGTGLACGLLMSMMECLEVEARMKVLGAEREGHGGALRAMEGSLWDGRIEVGVREMWCWLLLKGGLEEGGGRLAVG